MTAAASGPSGASAPKGVEVQVTPLQAGNKYEVWLGGQKMIATVDDPKLMQGEKAEVAKFLAKLLTRTEIREQVSKGIGEHRITLPSSEKEKATIASTDASGKTTTKTLTDQSISEIRTIYQDCTKKLLESLSKHGLASVVIKPDQAGQMDHKLTVAVAPQAQSTQVIEEEDKEAAPIVDKEKLKQDCDAVKAELREIPKTKGAFNICHKLYTAWQQKQIIQLQANTNRIDISSELKGVNQSIDRQMKLTNNTDGWQLKESLAFSAEKDLIKNLSDPNKFEKALLKSKPEEIRTALAKLVVQACVSNDTKVQKEAQKTLKNIHENMHKLESWKSDPDALIKWKGINQDQFKEMYQDSVSALTPSTKEKTSMQQDIRSLLDSVKEKKNPFEAYAAAHKLQVLREETKLPYPHLTKACKDTITNSKSTELTSTETDKLYYQWEAIPKDDQFKKNIFKDTATLRSALAKLVTASLVGAPKGDAAWKMAKGIYTNVEMLKDSDPKFKSDWDKALQNDPTLALVWGDLGKLAMNEAETAQAAIAAKATAAGKAAGAAAKKK